MKKTALLLALFGFLVWVGSALATDNATKDYNFPVNFKQGLLVGPQTATKPQIRRITYGTLDYDFPALGGTGAALDTLTAVSSSVTVTGARFGDACWVGIDQAPVSSFITFTARVTAANTAVIQASAPGITDAGTVNQADSGYTVYCIGGTT